MASGSSHSRRTTRATCQRRHRTASSGNCGSSRARVEIGYTWYSQSRQRTSLNTTCKLLLLAHAFDTLCCRVVGLRTDNFNFRSQRAIEGLGAKKDGVIRHHAARRDGSVRDTFIYSILASEWPDVRKHLELRLARHAAPADLPAKAGSHRR